MNFLKLIKLDPDRAYHLYERRDNTILVRELINGMKIAEDKIYPTIEAAEKYVKGKKK